MQTAATPWRAMRESVPGLSLREVSRRSGINPGRLSIIERGVIPTNAEAALLRSILMAAMDAATDIPDVIGSEDGAER